MIRALILAVLTALAVPAFADPSASASAGAGAFAGAGSSSSLTFVNQFPTVQDITTNTNGSVRVYQAPAFQAPFAPMTTPCVTGWQGTVSTPVGGGSIGSGTKDADCRAQNLGETYNAAGEKIPALRMWCSIEASFRANRDACVKVMIDSEYARMNDLFPAYMAKDKTVIVTRSVVDGKGGNVSRK